MKNSTKETTFNTTNTPIAEDETMNLTVIGKRVGDQFDGNVDINGSVGMLLKTALIGVLDMAFNDDGVFDLAGFEDLVMWATDKAIHQVLKPKKDDEKESEFKFNYLMMRWLYDNKDRKPDAMEVRKYFLSKVFGGEGTISNLSEEDKHSIDEFFADADIENEEEPTPEQRKVLEVAEKAVMLCLEKEVFTEEFIFTVNHYGVFISLVMSAMDDSRLPYDGDTDELAEAITAAWDMAADNFVELKALRDAKESEDDAEDEEEGEPVLDENTPAKKSALDKMILTQWYDEWDIDGVLDVLKDENGVVSQENKNKLWFATMLITQNCTAKHIDLPSSVIEAIEEKVFLCGPRVNDIVSSIVEELMHLFVTEKHFSEKEVYTVVNFGKIRNFVMHHPDCVSKDVEGSARKIFELINARCDTKTAEEG